MPIFFEGSSLCASSANVGAFFSVVSAALSLSQNDNLFFIEINCYFKITISYSHMV